MTRLTARRAALPTGAASEAKAAGSRSARGVTTTWSGRWGQGMRPTVSASSGRAPSTRVRASPARAVMRPPREDDADEVAGVDGAEVDALAALLAAADGAERLDGLRQGVLLADEAGHEAAAAHLAARLQASQRPQDVAPGHGDALAGQEVAEDDAVAGQQDLGGPLGQILGVEVGGGVADDGPAPGGAGPGEAAAGVARTPATPSRARAALAGQMSQALVAVGVDEPPGDEVAQGRLHFGGEAAAAVDDLVEEERPAVAQQVEHGAGRARHGLAGSGLVGRVGRGGGGRGPQEGEVGAQAQADGHDARRAGGQAGVPARLAGAEAAPGEGAVEAQLVEPGGVVVGQARGQQVALPGNGRGLEALQPLDDGAQPLLAAQAGVGRAVLPAQQEAHEVARADGLDLLAQEVEGVAMDARQETAVAEFVGAVGRRAGGAGRRQGAARDAGRREATAQHVAGGLDLDEPALDVLGAQAAAGRERRGRGAQNLAVAAQQARSGVLAVGDVGGGAEREGERRGDAPAREQQLDQGEVLGREPVPRRRAGEAACGLDGGGPALGGEVIEPGLPAGHVAVGDARRARAGRRGPPRRRGGRARPPRAHGRWPRGQARRGRGRRWAGRDAA